MVLPKEDRTRHELHTHLGKLGIEGTIIDPGTLDLDYDYPYLDLDAPTSGTTSLGSIRLHGYPINIINIIRTKHYEVGHVGFGGDYGPHEIAANGWYLRFFIISYDEWEVPLPSNLTEFNVTTKVNIEKGFLSSKVTDFTWEVATKDRDKTLIEETILEKITNNSDLRSLLIKELSKERGITIQSYKPKKTPKQIGAGVEASNAQIVLYGKPRRKKELFISRDCFDMYNRIAEHVLQAKASV